MIYTLGDRVPQFLGEYFVADGATVIGDVILGNNVNIWYNAVLRGDNDRITVGENTNIQESAVLHIDADEPLTVGNYVTVGHHVTLHGCSVDDCTMIGIGSIVLNGAKIGKRCLIGANTLIPEGREIPDGSLVVGSPGKVTRELSAEEIQVVENRAIEYVERAEMYKRDLKRWP